MAVYISDTPYTIPEGQHWRQPPGTWFLLWGDTSDEAQAIVWAVAGDPRERERNDCNAWEAYRLTVEELADALTLGVVLTDKFGPAEWLARRDGRTSMVERIEASRLR